MEHGELISNLGFDRHFQTGNPPAGWESEGQIHNPGTPILLVHPFC